MPRRPKLRSRQIRSRKTTDSQSSNRSLDQHPSGARKKAPAPSLRTYRVLSRSAWSSPSLRRSSQPRKAIRGGSAGYHPALLLGLLAYGYTTGVFSSRKLERATYDSVAFRFIAANDHPDHDTIATWRG
jgi:hypothetical protein